MIFCTQKMLGASCMRLLITSFFLFSFALVFGQVDTIPPVLKCKPSVSFSIYEPPFCSAIISTEFLIDTVYDNISAAQNLEFSVCEYSGNNCGQYYFCQCTNEFPTNSDGSLCDEFAVYNLGSYPSQLWVRDEGGNTSSCSTFIHIYDLGLGCESNNSVYLTGQIQLADSCQLELENVLIDQTVYDLSDSVLHTYLNQPSTTNYLSLYARQCQAVKVRPHKNDDPLNGVNTYDLLLIQKHLIGSAPISNPYKLLAADINQSKSITPSDLIELRKMILGYYQNGFPKVDSWQFVPQNFSFSNPENPFLDSIPNFIKLDTLVNYSYGIDFFALKTGDLDCSAQARTNELSEKLIPKSEFINIQNETLKAGETFKIGLKSPKAAAFQLDLGYKNVEFKKLDVPTKFQDAFYFDEKTQSIRCVSYEGMEAFSFEFVATQAGEIQDFFFLKNDGLDALAFSDLGEISGLELAFLEENFTPNAVLDTIPPVIICKPQITVNVTAHTSCFAPLKSAEFIESASDNVSVTQNLQYGLCIFPSYERCDISVHQGCTGNFPLDQFSNPRDSFYLEYGGDPDVQVWAKDEAGNSSFCTSKVELNPIHGNCDYGQTADLQGKIGRNSKDVTLYQAVENVDVKHAAFQDSILLYESDGKNNYGQGKYKFSGVTCHKSILKPSRDTDDLNGVNTYDLLLIQKHLIGNQLITNPYQLIAADVNNSGSISPSDIIEIRKTILGIYPDGFPKVDSWRFVPTKFEFTDSLNPFLDSIPFEYVIETIYHASTDLDFEAIKIGDLDNSSTNVSNAKTEERNLTVSSIFLKEKQLKKGEIFTLTLQAEESSAAYQFALLHPDLELMEIKSSESDTETYFAPLPEEHKLNCLSTSGKMEFELVFKAKKKGYLSDFLIFEQKTLAALAFDNQGNSSRLRLDFGKITPTQTTTKLNVFPNPFHEFLQFSFYQNTVEQMHLKITDTCGRLVFEKNEQTEIGEQFFNLDASLWPKGVLFLDILDGEERFLERVVRF